MMDPSASDVFFSLDRSYFGSFYGIATGIILWQLLFLVQRVIVYIIYNAKRVMYYFIFWSPGGNPELWLHLLHIYGMHYVALGYLSKN